MTCFLDVPEEAAHVLFVGIYDETEQDISIDSNYPGHRPNVQARFLTVTGTSLDTASSGDDSAYRNVGGTSFGTPLIAGALAILREADPRLTPPEAAGILLQTARRPAAAGYGQTCTSPTDLGTFATDCGAMKLGMGILDLPAALRSARYEAGRSGCLWTFFQSEICVYSRPIQSSRGGHASSYCSESKLRLGL